MARKTPSERLQIIVSGLVASCPFGGVFWDYMQYVLGLHRLGHDVLYIEDTGRWSYEPAAETFAVDAGAKNAEWLGRHIGVLEPELNSRWFLRTNDGRTYGRPWQDVVNFASTADLFINLSGSCWMRDEYLKAGRIAFVDSDPLYTQGALLAGSADEVDERMKKWKRHHDVFFTFAENIAGADCMVPTATIQWIPTRQPIVLDSLEPSTVPVAARRKIFTTVASWEPTERGPTIDGNTYGGKSIELRRFMDLPSQVKHPMELALSGPAPVEVMRARGWQVRDARGVSGDPWIYRNYLADSLAEWSVAKNAYVASRSGWFSCRTACYLAMAVPAIVQDTGFGAVFPTGDGLLSFSTVENAADAIALVADDPQRHSTAAVEIAREYFDAKRVLSRFVERAMSTSGSTRVG